MKQLINTLKQKPRHGGVPRGTQLGPVTIPTTTGQTNASAVTEQVQQLAQQLANEMFANAQATQLLARNGRVFTRFDMQNDVVSNQTEVVTAGLWRAVTTARRGGWLLYRLLSRTLTPFVKFRPNLHLP